LWNNIASKVKACFIETAQASVLSYENTVNET
jgi:hypothetical protein